MCRLASSQARCMAKITTLVARSAGHGMTSTTAEATRAVHTAAGLGCSSHPLVLASHRILLDYEDMDAFVETPSSAIAQQQQQAATLADDDELTMALAQSIDDVAAAGEKAQSATTSN